MVLPDLHGATSNGYNTCADRDSIALHTFASPVAASLQYSPQISRFSNKMKQIHAYESEQPDPQKPFVISCSQTAEVGSANDNASSWLSSCHRAIRHVPSHAVRHVPYMVSGKYSSRSTMTASGCDASDQQLIHHGGSLMQPLPAAICVTQQQQPLVDAATLKQQPLENLLEIAINLAGRSLNRTMAAFQAACQCWALAPDSEAASQALDFAEVCMARTMHRMQIVQQLAAAVLSSEQQQKHSAQQHEQQRLLELMQALQQQYNGMMHDDGTEEGEEVCSSWRRADIPADHC